MGAYLKPYPVGVDSLHILVSIIPDKTTLVDLYGIVDDLEELLGIHVDIITESSIPPEQRAVILKEAISV